jgi:23S rRNA pseudouridine2605 synthase
MGQSYFQKFVPKKKNSVIKEEHRQKKKKAKKERATAIDKFYDEKRKMKAAEREAALNTPVGKAIVAKTSVPDNPNPERKVTHPAAPKIVKATEPGADMPLNKYLAHCGVCSRREAVEHIKGEKVKVNGVVIKEPAFKVSEKDEVFYNGKKLFVTKNLVYILINHYRRPTRQKNRVATDKSCHYRKSVPHWPFRQEYIRRIADDE